MKPEIVKYHPACQDSIDLLLQSIADEYPERIFPPEFQRLSDVFNLPGRHYWCAMAGNVVAGTAGIAPCTVTDFVLKSMFVHKDYRGKDRGTAQMLLDTAEAEALTLGGEVMWLGTMAQFKAAQRFYEKHGYMRIAATEMPECCPTNDVDTVFFSKRLR